MPIGAGDLGANGTEDIFALLSVRTRRVNRLYTNNHISDQDNLDSTKCLIDNNMG